MSRLKPLMPSGWIMLCEPPASITSASPERMISSRLADGLRTGGAGRLAGLVRAVQRELAGDVPGRRVHLLLALPAGRPAEPIMRL